MSPQLLGSRQRETLPFAALGTACIATGLVPGLDPPFVLQAVLVGVLVALLGLPHGALDPLIARRVGLWPARHGWLVFHAVYVLLVAVAAALWFLAPTLGLIVFLAMTAFHFGDDWNQAGPLWLRCATGFGLLALPAVGHPLEVQALFGLLAGDGGRAVAQVLGGLGVLAIAGLLVAAVHAWTVRRSDTLEISVAATLAIVAPPLVWFIVYFCALHSPRHLRAAFNDARASGSLRYVVIIAYTAAPMLAALVVLNEPGQVSAVGRQLTQITFIGIACLSVPHMGVAEISKRRSRGLTRPSSSSRAGPPSQTRPRQAPPSRP